MVLWTASRSLADCWQPLLWRWWRPWRTLRRSRAWGGLMYVYITHADHWGVNKLWVWNLNRSFYYLRSIYVITSCEKQSWSRCLCLFLYNDLNMNFDSFPSHCLCPPAGEGCRDVVWIFLLAGTERASWIRHRGLRCWQTRADQTVSHYGFITRSYFISSSMIHLFIMDLCLFTLWSCIIHRLVLALWL